MMRVNNLINSVTVTRSTERVFLLMRKKKYSSFNINLLFMEIVQRYKNTDKYYATVSVSSRKERKKFLFMLCRRKGLVFSIFDARLSNRNDESFARIWHVLEIKSMRRLVLEL